MRSRNSVLAAFRHARAVEL